MRVILAVAAVFCLAFPLSAGAASSACTPGAQASCVQAVNSDLSAARRHRVSSKPACTGLGSVTQQLACLCLLHGGTPFIFRFPFEGVTCYSRVLL
jgi:hypothetical protein